MVAERVTLAIDSEVTANDLHAAWEFARSCLDRRSVLSYARDLKAEAGLPELAAATILVSIAEEYERRLELEGRAAPTEYADTHSSWAVETAASVIAEAFPWEHCAEWAMAHGSAYLLLNPRSTRIAADKSLESTLVYVWFLAHEGIKHLDIAAMSTAEMETALGLAAQIEVDRIFQRTMAALDSLPDGPMVGITPEEVRRNVAGIMERLGSSQRRGRRDWGTPQLRREKIEEYQAYLADRGAKKKAIDVVGHDYRTIEGWPEWDP